MQDLDIKIKSDIEELENCDPSLFIRVSWKYHDMEIIWYGFDMKFQKIFDFLSKLQDNKSCKLGGGGNGFWSLNHKLNSEYCQYNLDSSIKLKIKNNIIKSVIEKICGEITKFQKKYPGITSF